ncbi:MAG: hypothetical protein WAX89_01470 [Alphaproteobacteria bacterium]
MAVINADGSPDFWPPESAPALDGYVLHNLRLMGRRLQLPHDGMPTEDVAGYPIFGGIDSCNRRKNRLHAQTPLLQGWVARIDLVDGGLFTLGVEGGTHLLIRVDGDTPARYWVSDWTRRNNAMEVANGFSTGDISVYKTPAELWAMWPATYKTPFYTELKRLFFMAVGYTPPT